MEHQVAGIDWLRGLDTALLADEPGLGKSAQLLLAATEPILVVAPAMVLESGTWEDEIAKWRPDANITTVPYSNTYVGAGGKVQRGEWNVPQVQLKNEPGRQHWGTVICDEAHYLKGRKTSWAHALKQLRYDRLFQATGTPIPNWAHEAFMTLQFLWPAESKPGKTFGSYWRWVGEWFEVSPSFWNPQAKEIGNLRPDRTWDEFYECNWDGRMLLRLREDVLDLPPLTEMDWDCRMTGDQKKVYTQLKRDFIAWLDDGTEVQAWSNAALLVKLLKCATGLEALDLSRLRNEKLKPTGKYAVLYDLLQDRDRQTIVVGHFRDSVEAAQAWARRATDEAAGLVHGGVPVGQRTSEIRAFQQGRTKTLCATLATIREGMTLHQAGCDQIIFLEHSWTPSHNEQAMRRIHRIGQENPVLVTHLIAKGSMDERVQTFLKAKTDTQMKALGIKEVRALVS
jgi:SNF2 family DNA or RNA helicase